MFKGFAVVPVVLVAVGCGGGSPDRSTQIAHETGTTNCIRTQYGLKAPDGNKSTIYDCQRGARDVCLIERDGVATDVTAAAKILLAAQIDSEKPVCAT